MARRVALGLCLTLLICLTPAAALGQTASSTPAAEPSASGSKDAGGSVRDGAGESTPSEGTEGAGGTNRALSPSADYWSLLFVLALSTLIGLGVIVKVSRLLHTPLMSLTNAISAIAVVGAIIVTGGDHPVGIRVLGFIALFASTTNIVSGFMITDRMLKMFKQPGKDAKP